MNYKKTSLCFFIFSFFILIPNYILAGSWKNEAIDSPKFFLHAACAIDSNGKMHIIYGSDLIYHAYYDNNKWNYETVDYSTSSVRGVTIAIDLNNHVHIAYIEGKSECENGRVKYATNASGTWIIETIGYHGEGCIDIALDSSNKVHISYTNNYGDYKVMYATNITGDWTIESIGYTGTNWTYTSIALDSSDHVHITFFNRDEYALKYATNSSGSWFVETIDSDGYVGELATITVDSLDKVHIVYTLRVVLNNDNHTIYKYATNSSGAWVTENITEPVEIYYPPPSIISDHENHIHIIYSTINEEGGNRQIVYTNNKSGMWQNEMGAALLRHRLTTVSSSYNIPHFPSELLDYFEMISSGRKLRKFCRRNFTVSIKCLMIPFVFTGFMEFPVFIKIVAAT